MTTIPVLYLEACEQALADCPPTLSYESTELVVRGALEQLKEDLMDTAQVVEAMKRKLSQEQL